VTFRILVEHPEVFVAAVRAELATFKGLYVHQRGEFAEDD
jgi:hypothetical protein